MGTGEAAAQADELRAQENQARQQRRVLRFVLYGGPVLLWMAVVFVGSTDLGRYETSWNIVIRVLNFLCPEFAQPPEKGLQLNISMYQINTAMRRLAHIFLYAMLTFLTVRALQQGKPRLRMRSLVAAFLITMAYAGTDELHRYFEQHRHAKWSDIALNLYGIAFVLGGTILFFGLKAWERKLDAPLLETPETEQQTVPPADENTRPQHSSQTQKLT